MLPAPTRPRVVLDVDLDDDEVDGQVPHDPARASGGVLRRGGSRQRHLAVGRMTPNVAVHAAGAAEHGPVRAVLVERRLREARARGHEHPRCPDGRQPAVAGARAVSPAGRSSSGPRPRTRRETVSASGRRSPIPGMVPMGQHVWTAFGPDRRTCWRSRPSRGRFGSWRAGPTDLARPPPAASRTRSIARAWPSRSSTCGTVSQDGDWMAGPVTARLDGTHAHDAPPGATSDRRRLLRSDRGAEHRVGVADGHRAGDARAGLLVRARARRGRPRSDVAPRRDPRVRRPERRRQDHDHQAAARAAHADDGAIEAFGLPLGTRRQDVLRAHRGPGGDARALRPPDRGREPRGAAHRARRRRGARVRRARARVAARRPRARR